MSRLQIVVAVGLFLIVGLFAWQTYLEKSAQKNRSDERGVPAEVRAGLKKHQDAAAKAKAKASTNAKSKGSEQPNAGEEKAAQDSSKKDDAAKKLGDAAKTENKAPSPKK